MDEVSIPVETPKKDNFKLLVIILSSLIVLGIGGLAFYLVNSGTTCNDLDCFINISEECGNSNLNYISNINLFGVNQKTTTDYEMKKEGDKCKLDLVIKNVEVEFGEEIIALMKNQGATQEEIDQKEKEANENLKIFIDKPASCNFKQKDLTAMLKRWRDGSFSTTDYDVAECSGEYFELGENNPIGIDVSTTQSNNSSSFSIDIGEDSDTSGENNSESMIQTGGEACTNLGECSDNFYCDNFGSKTCVPKLDEGVRDCGDLSSLNYPDFSMCKDGLYCNYWETLGNPTNDGVCSKKVGEGVNCQDHSACIDGYHCDFSPTQYTEYKCISDTRLASFPDCRTSYVETTESPWGPQNQTYYNTCRHLPPCENCNSYFEDVIYMKCLNDKCIECDKDSVCSSGYECVNYKCVEKA